MTIGFGPDIREGDLRAARLQEEILDLSRSRWISAGAVRCLLAAARVGPVRLLLTEGSEVHSRLVSLFGNVLQREGPEAWRLEL